MTTARDQNAWISNPGLGQTIYIYLINFERKSNPSLTVTLSELSDIADKCSNSNYEGSTFYCQNCPQFYTGVYCNISNHVLYEFDHKQTVLSYG